MEPGEGARDVEACPLVILPSKRPRQCLHRTRVAGGAQRVRNARSVYAVLIRERRKKRLATRRAADLAQSIGRYRARSHHGVARRYTAERLNNARIVKGTQRGGSRVPHHMRRIPQRVEQHIDRGRIPQHPERCSDLLGRGVAAA